jgi:hypothetical protein
LNLIGSRTLATARHLVSKFFYSEIIIIEQKILSTDFKIELGWKEDTGFVKI